MARTVHPAIVDAANADQLQAWDGPTGSVWALNSDAFDAAVAGYQPALLSTTGLVDGERVLDIGCGAGRTSLDAARRTPTGDVLGVDLSTELLRVARGRARREGLNVTFAAADAQVYAFRPAAADLAVSRLGTMFFADPVAAFANIRAGVRRGGRLAMLTWRAPAENAWQVEITRALTPGRDVPATAPPGPGPFALADPDRTRSLLVDAGFAHVSVEPLDGHAVLGADVASAEAFVLTFAGSMLDDLRDRDRALTRLRALLAAAHDEDGVRLASAAWLVTARRP